MPLPTNVRDAYSRHEVVQSRFFLAELRDAFLMLAFFLSVVRFLEATFFATFFFVRELGFFAPIAVATLSHATPGAAVAVAAAETAAAAAALASSPVRVLVPSAALLAAATTVSCARVLMLFRVIFHRPEDTQKHRTRANQSLEEVQGGSTRMSFGSLADSRTATK